MSRREGCRYRTPGEAFSEDIWSRRRERDKESLPGIENIMARLYRSWREKTSAESNYLNPVREFNALNYNTYLCYIPGQVDLAQSLTRHHSSSSVSPVGSRISISSDPCKRDVRSYQPRRGSMQQPSSARRGPSCCRARRMLMSSYIFALQLECL